MKNKLISCFLLFVLASFIFCLSGCSNNNTADETVTEESIKTNVEAMETTIETTVETTTEVTAFNFLKTNATYISEDMVNKYNGFNNSDSIITDVNEIEYQEYNANKTFKNIILDNDKYMVYYYYNSEDNKLNGYKDIYVIDKAKNKETPSILVPYYFGYEAYYTGENVICGDILWTKSLTKDAKRVLDNNLKYTEDSFYNQHTVPELKREYWQFIDLTGKNGALSSEYSISLSPNREYFCYGDFSDYKYYSVIGDTTTLEFAQYKTVDGYNIATNDGTIIIFNNDGIHSVFKNDNNFYNFKVEGSLLYASENAVYLKNNYGVLKYSNEGEDLIIKFIDFDRNTKASRYIINNSNSPYILLKGENKQEEINLDNY